MFLSLRFASPPKTPRNVFFPWQTLNIHQSGAFLERNRLALRVPVNLTKFEIREYLRRLYDAKVIKVNSLIKVPEIRRNLSSKKLNYYRNGPIYKKAIITLEDSVPDEIKMIQSSKHIYMNPAITKKNVSYGVKSDMKPKPSRLQLWEMGEMRNGWKLSLPQLLAGDDWQLHPNEKIDEDHTQMQPDTSLPFMHRGVSKTSRKPDNVPKQEEPAIDITPWRRRINRLLQSGTVLKQKKN